MKNLSPSQLRVLKAIHTGHGESLWGMRHSGSAASAFERTAGSLRGMGLAVYISQYTNSDVDVTGYRHALTDAGKAILFAQPTWQRYAVLRDAGVVIGIKGVDVAYFEERVEALRNAYDLTGASDLRPFGYAFDSLAMPFTVPQLRALAKAYGVTNVPRDSEGALKALCAAVSKP